MRDDVDECVITTSGSVEDEDTVGEASRCADACFALKDDGHRLVDPSGSSSRTYLVHEHSGGARSIPPPACRLRSDHVCRIND